MRFPNSSCNPGKHERHHAPNDLLQLLQCVLQPPAAVPQSCRITHTPLARSCANAFRHLQLQSRIAGASHQIEQHAQQGRFCSLCPSVFRYFSAKTGSHYSLVRFLGDSFTRSNIRGNIDPTSATRGATLPVKAQGLAPHFHGFTSEPTHSQTVTVIFCYHCGWHDEKTDHGHSFVTRKFANYKLPLI